LWYSETIEKPFSAAAFKMWSFYRSTFLLVRTVVDKIFGGHGF